MKEDSKTGVEDRDFAKPSSAVLGCSVELKRLAIESSSFVLLRLFVCKIKASA